MADIPHEKTSDRVQPKATIQAWLAGLLVVLGSFSGTVVVKVAIPGADEANRQLAEISQRVEKLSASNPRPDPWTRTQALGQAEKEAGQLENLKEKTTLETARIQQQISTLQARLDRLTNKVDQHNEDAGLWKGRINANTYRIEKLER